MNKTGIPIKSQAFTPDLAGVNNLIMPLPQERLRFFKVFLSPSADIVGEVYLSIGSNKIGSLQSPKGGGEYILLSSFPNFVRSEPGEQLTLTLPSATTVSVIVHWMVEEWQC